MSEERIREHLAAFGLSSTEIETYLAVLRRGRATTGDVAAAADVSQGYVYDVAETLVDRGLVTVDESATPTVLRARPAAEAVAELSTRLSDLQSAVEDAYSEPAATDVGFEVVRSRQTVERRAKRFLADATHEAFVVVPATSFGDLKPAMAGAVDRGVFVYCMLVAPDTDVVADAVADFGEYAHVVRTWEARPQVIVLRDARAGLVGSHGVLTGRHGDEYAVSFGQPEVANGFYGNMVSNVWPMGDLRHVSDPPELPATFEYFRNGVTTAAQQLAADRDLVADVTVADTGSDHDHELDLDGVPVLEAKQGLVPPVTSDFPVENALVVEAESGPVSIGGDSPGFDPYFEAFAARRITLREA
ncbi:TrmB family transcriptional regulator [Halosimplex salinum]|uniref:TrmB family transcriptional regulator n=1 Tax=Halosimplex salinum TaxID=1710538 RepID=UPI000F45F24B|nr:TrmB family transcriptional regulator sugar-binding domain-containing protein [Halosimplex salinum]